MRPILRTAAGLLILTEIACLGLLLHEGGHAITAVLLGGTITEFGVMPGIKLYPVIELQPWSGWLAYINYDLPNASLFDQGLISLMGSGFTALISYPALAVLLLFRPRGWVRFALVCTAILFTWDILSYSLFPAIGARHWVFIGGRYPEPLVGAMNMGFSPMVYFIGLGLHASIIHGSTALLIYYERLVKPRRARYVK
jgi:hypothetical protein